MRSATGRKRADTPEARTAVRANINLIASHG